MFQHIPESHSGFKRLMRFPLFLFLVALWLTDFARAQWTVIDAGAAWTFNGASGAASSTWRINGETVSTNPSLVYTPDINAVGTHWLQCVQTFADGTKSTKEWGLRVRIPLPASDLQLFVAPNGSDTNTGSIGSPFLTLEKARDTIRALPRPLPPGGVTVYLRGGTYRRSSTFSLTTSDSGDSASAPIIYAGYPGETAIVSNGKALNSTDFAPLAASETSRVAPGVDPTRIWEADLTALGIANKGPFPADFDHWPTYNIYASSYDGGIFDVYYNNTRAWISRYPNQVPDEMVAKNPILKMNGVALSADGVNHLKTAGTYETSGGTQIAVGGAFHYNDVDASHVERWQTGIANGGAWVQGHWNNSWTIDGVKLLTIDPGKKVIALDTAVSIQNGLGSKYVPGAGSYAEPWWVLNLLEEMDQAGEWCIDFSRNKLYFLMDSAGAPADGSVVIADRITPTVDLSGSHVMLQNITFQEALGNSVKISGGTRNLVTGCKFRNVTNMAVHIEGSYNGVVSCDMSELGGGGVYLRCGSVSPRVASNNFVVNNRITTFGRVARVYQGAVDAGYGGAPKYGGNDTAVGVRVAHNQASNTPHGGIFHGSFDSVFEYNDVGDYCLFSDDMGGFYSFPKWQNGAYLSGGHTFRYNYVHDAALGNAFYFDLSHDDMTLYGNVTHKTVRNSWYKHGDQVTSGVPQLVFNYNNLSIEDGAGFEFVAPKPTTTYPSKIENNATVGVGSPFKSQEVIVTNGIATSLGGMTSSAALLESTPNSHKAYASDIGFVNMANDDFRLSPAAALYTELPGFKPIPFELIGLYNDEYRSGIATRSPFVLNGSAAVSGTSAVISGSLAFPQFEANTTVKLYWGTTDGGSNPGSWENVTDLGARPAGPLTPNLTGLTAGTTYYFRFFASNTAGSNWASSTGNTSANGTNAALAPPNSLLLHLDASAASTIVKDGSNKVSRWNDADGGTNYVAQTTATAQPTATTDATLGKTVVDFGALVTGSTGKWMQIKNAAGSDLDLSTIKTVIAVMKGANHLLGDNDKYDFHRVDPASATSALWSSSFASANIRNGKTYLNGAATAINGTSTAMPSGYWLASVVTNGNSVEASRLACDRTNRTGGQQICELLVYDTVLSDADRIVTEDYLLKKWLNIGGADTAPPVITVPANATVSASGTGEAAVTYTAQAIDNIDGPITPTFSPPSGTVFPAGTTTVTASATDAAGNTATKSFTISVSDNLGPILSVPTDITVEAAGAGGSVVNFTTSAFDAVNGQRTTTSTPASGSTFSLGSTTVTTTATDAVGNTSRETFSVTVRDTTAPAITAPASVTAEATGPGGAVVNFATSATDVVSGTLATTNYPVSGSIFPLGATTVTTRATDAAGNQAIRSFTVTVADTTPPVIPALPNLTAEATEPGGAAVNFTIPATDLVDAAPVTSSNPSSGSMFNLGDTIVTATAVDVSGNSYGTFTVTVRDTTPPEITVPANMTVETTDSNGALVSFSTSATDLMSGSRPTLDTPASGSLFALGTTTVTTTSLDATGNAASKTFTVKVQYPLPAAPVGLVATPGNAQVSLSWSAVPFASTYNIKRATFTGGPYAAVASVSGTSFLDTGRANGLTYYYVVSAVNATGEGVNSGEATASLAGGSFLKADNTTALGLSGSWTGNAVPATGDTALWNGTYATGNASVSIGTGIFVNRIQVTSPSRAITITAGSGSLTLGGADVPGIDMTSASQNLAIQAPVILANSQVWSVNTGRALTVSGGVGQLAAGMALTKTGAGTLLLSGTQSFTGGLILSTGILELPGGSSTGQVTVNGTLNITGSTALTVGALSGSGGTGIIDYKNTLAGGNSLTFAPGAQSFGRIGNTTASGSLTLNASGSVLSVGNLGYNTGSGWSTTVNGGTWNVGALGVNGTGAQNGGIYQITGGAAVSVTSPRYGGHGTYNVGGAGGAGTLNFGSGLSSENGGALGFVVRALSGGVVTFQGLTLALPNAVTTANELSVQTGGQATVTGTLTVGNTTAGKTETNTINLDGGKLLVSGTIQANTATVGQTRTFNWTGGQLTAGTIIASANFNAPAAGGITTTALEQTVGTLAPGDIGTAGRTVITGGYNQGAGGTLAIDIGGATQANGYQVGQYDYLPVSGVTTLAGNLAVSLINGFIPSNAATFTILNSTGGLSGNFANAAAGQRIVTSDHAGSLLVSKSGNTVTLSGYTALNALESWRHTYFNTTANSGDAADAADPDGDGMQNLMEYALGTVPNSVVSRSAPVLSTAGDRLTLSFMRARSDVTYIVEGGSDLMNWPPVATNPGTIGQNVIVTDTVDISTANPPRRFLRLRVTNS